MMELLEKKKKILMGFSDLLEMFREMESIQAEVKDMEVNKNANLITRLKRSFL